MINSMKRLNRLLMLGGCFSLFFTGNAFAADYPHVAPDRPANGTGNTAPVYAGPAQTNNSNSLITPYSYPVTVFSPPSTIEVSIWNRDSTGAETTYINNVTVNFTDYVKDVLPNEWIESWGTDGQAALEAGALAVKTYGWYHVIAWKKDPDHSANVTNGTKSQMYTAGSNKPNCNKAVQSMNSYVIGQVKYSNGTAYGTIVETGYLANQTTPGKIMGQKGTYTDAKNGMTASQIISKWYSDLGVSMTSYTVIL